MADKTLTRDRARCPTHPGAILREDVLPALGLSKVEFAEKIMLSRQQLYNILNEKQPVTAATAIKLSRLIGGDAERWLRMQMAYDLWQAERQTDLSKIEPFRAA